MTCGYPARPLSVISLGRERSYTTIWPRRARGSSTWAPVSFGTIPAAFVGSAVPASAVRPYRVYIQAAIAPKPHHTQDARTAALRSAMAKPFFGVVAEHTHGRRPPSGRPPYLGTTTSNISGREIKRLDSRESQQLGALPRRCNADRFRPWLPCFQVVTDRLSLCFVPIPHTGLAGVCLSKLDRIGERPFLLGSLFDNATIPNSPPGHWIATTLPAMH